MKLHLYFSGIALSLLSTVVGQDNSVEFAGGTANGNSLAFGDGGEAYSGSFAFGQHVGVLDRSFGFGDFVYADEEYSFVFGLYSYTASPYSFAFGLAAETYADYSFAFGNNVLTEGDYSFSFGRSTYPVGDYSFAFGNATIAETEAAFVIGQYNEMQDESFNAMNSIPEDEQNVFVIGNGTSDSSRSNALTVYKNGRMFLSSSTTGLQIYSGFVSNNSATAGIYVHEGNQFGGYFLGRDAAIFAKASDNSNPDIILAGVDSGNTNDDGIIASDPNISGSDIYLRSNDAVVIELDHNASSTNSSFQVHDSAGSVAFRVFEDGNANLAGNLTQFSDRRLKKDITDLPYGLNEILQLQPKAYHWKKNKQEHKSLGLIAQDVQPIIKEIVNIQDDELKTLGISYTELIPVLIKAIQEQNKIIENQENTLKASKNNYEALLSRIEILEYKSSN